MAPIKLEDQLKDKLESRRLQPSAESWNSLQDRLDAQDRKEKSRSFLWIGIAATLVGVILISSQFLKGTDTNNELPTIVNTEVSSENLTEPNDKSNNQEVIVAFEDHKTLNTNETVVKTRSEEIKKATVLEKSQNKVDDSKKQDAVASIANKTKASELEEVIPIKDISIEDLKVMEIVSEIKERQKLEASVTDREIDSLLKQAQRDILKQKIFDERTQTVNANALLQDVEVELEQSFRAKVFDALKSSYNSVKTAVAERRN